MKRALVIAYHFPPTGGMTAIRMAKTVKGLARAGWDATVLRASGLAYYARDPELLADLPSGTRIRDVRALEPLRLLGALRRLGLGSKALLWLERFLFIPDPQAAWLPGAVWAGLSEVRRARPDAIHATGAPWTALVAGAAISRLSGVPYVPHFADEWIRDSAFLAPTPLHRAAARWLEDRVLASASAVTVPNALFAERFRARRPWLEASRFVEIPNGYDEDDFRSEATRDPARFTLAHAGSLYLDVCDPRPFLRALSRFLEEDPSRKPVTRLRLLGFVEAGFREEAMRLGLDPFVSFEGSRSHTEAVEAMRTSDALLLFLTPYDGVALALRGKSFEYLRAGTPILAMIPGKGALADLLRRAGAEAPLDPFDEEGALERLRTLYARWKVRTPIPPLNPEVVSAYERQRIAGALAGVLERASR